ncbi:2-oxo acid dehydrogenase subunit E2 [Streptomyces uncialis]|uniref:dihydrolipoamide acetyltransferase family protein n=1 Tax=Streptomyces uncialis TaxID=1048205 RepID=UPI002E35ED65|nr:dihydrolipoamide acetyltransferase family protein [Streptomyces uncialis]
MAQVLEFKLPDLGEGLTEAEIVHWLVEVGDVVAVDQPVVEVETAKAMVEVPCPYGGVVTARFGEEGTELPVGAPLITVAVGALSPDEVPDALETATPAPSGTADPAAAHDAAANDAAPSGSAANGSATNGSATNGAAREADGASGNVLVGYGTAAAPARRRRVGPTRPTATVPRTAPATGTPGTPGPAPVGIPVSVTAGRDTPAAPGTAPARGDGPVPVISPLVRRLAREHGIDLAELAGSGPDGLILRADVEYAAHAARTRPRAVPGQDHATTPAPRPSAESSPADRSVPAGGVVRTPLKGVRGAVADKLARSRREIPEATVWVDADATELMRARTAMNAGTGPRVSLLALLARICAAGLKRYPELNSTVDTAAREIVRFDALHLGFAAQTPRGLVVPVVKDAHTRDAESLSAEFARLTDAAREGRLTPAELTGGTFTLNNYGVFGVDGSTPIINHPEAAMLGVGRIIPRPWVHEGELAVRQVVELTLTFDHRVCDGGVAGGFLRYVADCVEQPAVLLRTL